MDDYIDKILNVEDAAMALQAWGFDTNFEQVKRAARRPPGIMSVRKIPFMVCPISSRLVIRESALRAWFNYTYPSSPSPTAPAIASVPPAPTAPPVPPPPQPPQVRPVLARSDRPVDRKTPNFQISTVSGDQKVVFPLGTSKRL
ncbi:MAG: hypothetical protein WCJ64_06690 [Rhodospirillaceae bacterium]